MASKPLTPQATNTIGGIVGVLVTLGIVAYLYLIMAKVEPTAPIASTYNLGQVKKELTAGDNVNVFVKMSDLSAAPTYGDSGDTSVSYTTSDIGKTDLTLYGK